MTIPGFEKSKPRARRSAQQHAYLLALHDLRDDDRRTGSEPRRDGVLASDAPAFFALWGIPFVLMGLYLTVGRFFADSYRRRRTTYALTARRIIVRSGATTQSLDLATLATMSLREHSSGLGTITFGSPLFPMAFASSSWPGAKGPPEFTQIPDARRVYDRIRDAQQQAQGPRAS